MHHSASKLAVKNIKVHLRTEFSLHCEKRGLKGKSPC